MSKGNGITPTNHESYSPSPGEQPPSIQTGKCGPHQISYGGFVDDLSTAQRVIAFAFLTILPPIGWIVLGGVLADCLIFYATHQFSPQKEDMVKKEVPQPQKVGVDESAVQRLPVLPGSIKQIQEMWAKQQIMGRAPFSLLHLLMEKGIGFGEPGNSDEANLSKFKEIVDELSQEVQQALAAQLKDIEESKDDDDIEQSTIDDLAPLLFKKNDRDPLSTHQAKYMQNTLNFLIRNRKELFPESESINIPPSPTVAQPEKAMNGGEVSLDQQPGETDEEYVNRLTEKLANVENALPPKVKEEMLKAEAQIDFPIFALSYDGLQKYKSFQGDELFPIGNLQKLLGEISPEKQKVLKKMVDYFEGQEIVRIPEQELRKFSTSLFKDIMNDIMLKDKESLATDADNLLYAFILHKKELFSEKG